MSEPYLIQSLPQAIDPLAPCPAGRYVDHLVSVLRAERLDGPGGGTGPVIRTEHFCLTRQCWRAPTGANGAGPGPISAFAPVYAHALQLIPAGRVLDVGSCFGFLPLLLAERPANTVTASDLSGGTMRLLATVAAARGVQVSTLVCEAARIPVADDWAETVSVIHLLEHVSPEHARAVLGEALRVARRQVVVAVPFEEQPSAAYGHVDSFDLRQLRDLGERTGRPWSVHEHHGGWLVVTAG